MRPDTTQTVNTPWMPFGNSAKGTVEKMMLEVLPCFEVRRILIRCDGLENVFGAFMNIGGKQIPVRFVLLEKGDEDKSVCLELGVKIH